MRRTEEGNKSLMSAVPGMDQSPYNDLVNSEALPKRGKGRRGGVPQMYKRLSAKELERIRRSKESMARVIKYRNEQDS